MATVTLTAEDVGTWINDPGAHGLDVVAVVAAAHVTQMTSDLEDGQLPPEVLKLAALDVAADLWDQRSAPNGVRMFSDGLDGLAHVRVRADATARARRILAPWLPPTIT